jgi:DNA polymerase III subunit epsilon
MILTEIARARAASAPAVKQRPLLFLDFEASSLDPRSWPVEIGYAWAEAGRIAVRSAVIAPRPDWPLHAWSEAAEGVHGLSLRRVRAGRPADRVAAASDAFADFEVVSDNAHWDQRWLDRLRDGRPRIAVRPLAAVTAERLDAEQADALALALLRARSAHRAGEDAARLASAWAEATGAATAGCGSLSQVA